MKLLSQILFAVLLLATFGCRVHSVNTQLDASENLMDSFGEGSTLGTSRAPEKWWLSFQDVDLNRFVNEALGSNTSMSQAWARLAQAEALSSQAGAAASPTVSADVGAGRSRTPSFFGDNQESNQFNAGVSVGYEVDLWGRVRDLNDAARLDVEASRLDVETMAMTLTAQVTDAWFDVIEQTHQLRLIQKQIQVSQDYLSLVEFRFSQGDAVALDVFQQRQSLAGLESRTPNADLARKLAEHRLALLLGRLPALAPKASESGLPMTPPLPASGIPADLLGRRPDLKAAELRVIASDHRVGAALANQLPGLRLGAQIGTQAPNLDDLVSDFVWSIFASVGATIWDGGRLEAEVIRSKAVVREKVQFYAGTLLQCVKEVEDALAQNRNHHQYIVLLETQRSLAAATLSEARNRYVNGLSSYLPVLTALQGLQELERSALRQHRVELMYRTHLFRALGGTWFQDLNNPHKSSDEKEKENAS
jgi:NodT family efflux transporter outer membrane factor (OMF) lipoprotein